MAGTPDSELLSSLYVTDPSNDLQSLKRKKGNRVEGTCEWILTNPQLVKWIDIPDDSSVEPVSRTLWLHGRPGQGKSTLAMHITEALTASFKDDSTKALSYFFCDASYATRTTANSILRGLLWHFYTSHPELIPTYARQRYSQLRDDLFRDFDHLWTLLLETVAANASCQFYCIIDALDECGEESRIDILRQIEQTFGTGHGPTNLHFLLLSRPYAYIRDYLGQFESLDLASLPQVKNDVRQYISFELEKLTKLKQYPSSLK